MDENLQMMKRSRMWCMCGFICNWNTLHRWLQEACGLK